MYKEYEVLTLGAELKKLLEKKSEPLMQKYGHTTYFSKESEKNIKITTVEDIEIFKALLHAKNDAWIKE